MSRTKKNLSISNKCNTKLSTLYNHLFMKLIVVFVQLLNIGLNVIFLPIPFELEKNTLAALYELGISLNFETCHFYIYF